MCRRESVEWLCVLSRQPKAVKLRVVDRVSVVCGLGVGSVAVLLNACGVEVFVPSSI